MIPYMDEFDLVPKVHQYRIYLVLLTKHWINF